MNAPEHLAECTKAFPRPIRMETPRGERPDDHAGTNEPPSDPDDAGEAHTSTD